MSEITNPHDSCFRQLMTNTDNARAFFQRYLSPELQGSIDLDTLALQSGSAVAYGYPLLGISSIQPIRLNPSQGVYTP